jgi:hypothetical protein
MTQPTIGMPCTYSIGADCYAGQLTEVSASGKTVVANCEGLTVKATLRRDGKFRPVGASYSFLSIGRAVSRRDPSF